MGEGARSHVARTVGCVPLLRVTVYAQNRVEIPCKICVCVCVCDLYFQRWILVQRWAGRLIWLRSAEASL